MRWYGAEAVAFTGLPSRNSTNHMDVLLVEDSPTDCLVINARLRRAFPKAQIYVADEPHKLKEYLRHDGCDVVVTDYWLGWSDGLSVLQRVRERWPRARVIILTGNGGEEVVAGGLKYGLFYYLLKPDEFEELASVAKAAYESKRREESLELMGMIVNSMPASVMGIDAEGIVAASNESARLLYGYSEEEIVGHRFEMLLPAEIRDEARRLHALALGGKIIPTFSTTRVHSDGTEIGVSLTIVPVRGEDGRITCVGYIANALDQPSRVPTAAIPASGLEDARFEAKNITR